MPSLDDVYRQLQNINANLQVLHADEGLLKGSEDAVKTAVDAGTAEVHAVLTAINQTIQQLQSLVTAQAVTNQALLHISQQNDALICILEHISKNTCSLLNEAHIQTGLQKSISSGVAGLLDIDETVHPEAALGLERRTHLQSEIERCCPRPAEKPVCEYAPCEAPPPLKLKKE